MEQTGVNDIGGNSGPFAPPLDELIYNLHGSDNQQDNYQHIN